MHETHLLDSIFKYLSQEEKISSKKIRRVCLSLSEIGGISETHFREHFAAQAAGTKWAGLEWEFKSAPFGPELEITRLDFE